MGASARPVQPLTLHSSWRSVVGGYIGPLVLLSIAWLAVNRRGSSPLVVVIAVIGLGLLAVLLFDFPISTRFDERGVERRMPLRRHRLSWGDIRALTRTRGRLFSRAQLSPDVEVRSNRGGLVAAVGRRRYLLVDQVESRDEFVALQQLLERTAPELVDESLLPPPDSNPTFLYRRRRWHRPPRR